MRFAKKLTANFYLKYLRVVVWREEGRRVKLHLYNFFPKSKRIVLSGRM